MSHETRQVAQQLRAVNRSDRTVDVVASTYDLDSYGTRIDQSGWDLETFKKNPVICLQHDDRGYTSSNGLPIANAIPETIRVENQRLLMRLRFPEQGKFPLADQVFELVADGFMRGLSVGFMPTEWDDTTEVAPDGREFTVRIYRKQQLLELSLVTIPSNDNALVQQRAKEMNADPAMIRTMTEQLDKLIGESDQEAKAAEDLRQYKASHLLKCVQYYDAKQKANRESTKVLERFYKRILETDPPADEVEAWKGVGEAVEALTPVEKLETKPEVEHPETNPEITQEEILEVPTPPSNPEPVVEAPQPERKAFVQIRLKSLSALPRALSDVSLKASEEALQRGYPVKELDGVLDALAEKVKASLISQ